jgi:protein Tob/BTG
MINEVNSVVNFISKLLRQRNVPMDLLDRFRTSLSETLHLHYRDHWFPEKPFRGSAYRCVRVVNKVMDPVLVRAGKSVGLSQSDLLMLLPSELTLWVDPNDVSYRIGEDGSIGILYPDSEDDSKPADSRDQCQPVFQSCKDQHNHLGPPRSRFCAETGSWDMPVGVVSG